ncbi:hypothetical protein IWZ03DRAFT_55766 [Phyllosticta citriasiana]|uniref:Uncharacterized protein n=1 Tax=Phyllosticta citriasiana TaxID=595635 RepID=A0ABR1KEQ9_9PEZI
MGHEQSLDHPYPLKAQHPAGPLRLHIREPPRLCIQHHQENNCLWKLAPLFAAAEAKAASATLQGWTSSDDQSKTRILQPSSPLTSPSLSLSNSRAQPDVVQLSLRHPNHAPHVSSGPASRAPWHWGRAMARHPQPLSFVPLTSRAPCISSPDSSPCRTRLHTFLRLGSSTTLPFCSHRLHLPPVIRLTSCLTSALFPTRPL